MDPDVQTFTFAPDGDIPNNALPLLLYRHALPPELQNPAAAQALLRENGWGGNWVNGVFDYWHYHVTGHEVLACVEGEAEVGFGGDGGGKVTFAAGDIVVIPAGVGHKRLSERRGGFTVVGGYPPGQSGAITRAGEMPVERGARGDRRARSAARRSAVRAGGAADRGVGHSLVAYRCSSVQRATSPWLRKRSAVSWVARPTMIVVSDGSTTGRASAPVSSKRRRAISSVSSVRRKGRSGSIVSPASERSQKSATRVVRSVRCGTLVRPSPRRSSCQMKKERPSSAKVRPVAIDTVKSSTSVSA